MSMTITIMGCVLTVMLTALGVMTIAWMWYCIRRDKVEMIIELREHEAVYGSLSGEDETIEVIDPETMPAEAQKITAELAEILEQHIKSHRRLN